MLHWSAAQRGRNQTCSSLRFRDFGFVRTSKGHVRGLVEVRGLCVFAVGKVFARTIVKIQIPCSLQRGIHGQGIKVQGFGFSSCSSRCRQVVRAPKLNARSPRS